MIGFKVIELMQANSAGRVCESSIGKNGLTAVYNNAGLSVGATLISCMRESSVPLGPVLPFPDPRVCFPEIQMELLVYRDPLMDVAHLR